MCEYGRRLIVERSFDPALWSVIEAFIREGFFLKACDVRRLVRCTTGGDVRRYVLLQATHPDFVLKALKLDLDAGVLLPCEIAVYELADGNTAVTVGGPMAPVASSESWRTAHPGLAALFQGLNDRVGRALDAVSSGGIPWMTAA